MERRRKAGHTVRAAPPVSEPARSGSDLWSRRPIFSAAPPRRRRGGRLSEFSGDVTGCGSAAKKLDEKRTAGNCWCLIRTAAGEERKHFGLCHTLKEKYVLFQQYWIRFKLSAFECSFSSRKTRVVQMFSYFVIRRFTP